MPGFIGAAIAGVRKPERAVDRAPPCALAATATRRLPSQGWRFQENGGIECARTFRKFAPTQRRQRSQKSLIAADDHRITACARTLLPDTPRSGFPATRAARLL